MGIAYLQCINLLPMQTASKKVINGWAMYDWANSVYNLVITTTFFPIYFIAITKSSYGEETVPFLGRNFINSALYDYALAFAYLLIAVLLPILSSIADSRGNKKKFMQFFCYLGGLSCISLYFFQGDKTSPPNVYLGLLSLIGATIGYVGSLVFYNSYLPEIAAPEDRDRISAKGFSRGYVGSVIMQIIGFALVVYFGDSDTRGVLYTFVLVGLWWIGFAQITFRTLPPSAPAVAEHKANFLTEGFVELKKVFQQIMKMKVLKTFLFSFFFYSMGVQTIMLAASIIGSKLLHLPSQKLIITIVIIQLVASVGAIGMSRLSKTIGNLKVLMLVVLFWVFLCVGGYFLADFAKHGGDAEYYFYALAVGVGLVMGGIQSMSRSTYSKLMPETKDTASFFSFYDVTEKLAIVFGLFTFGALEETFGMQNALLSLVVFFAIGFGGLILARKFEKEAA
jgi:MFS transporter, UMF1 family